MPKMTHWNSPDPIDVAPEKASTYSAQGWVVVSGGKGSEPAVTAMTTQDVEPDEASKPAAKKTPAKRAAKSPAKKAAKKS